MTYKISSYNILTKIKNKNLIFSTKSLALIEIEDKYYNIFKNNDNEAVNSLDKELKDQLFENGFIVFETTDEIKLLKELYWNEKINSNILHITVMTTLDCNFKCIYCFEEKKNTTLDRETQEKIISYLSEVIHNYDVLHIDWYGGEPLLNMQAIEYLSTKAIQLCEENNKEYVATITTNGYGLTPEVTDKLTKLKVKSAQITIDGPKNVHDKRRMLQSGKGSFNEIINNIKSAINKMNVNLRINVDRDTIDTVDDLFQYLVDNNLRELSISIKGVVSAEANPREEYTIEEEKFALKSLEKYKLAFKLGLKPAILSTFDYFAPRFCIVDLDSQLIISPDGYIYKCGESYNENDPGRIGKLNNNGSLSIDKYKKSLWDKDPFDNLDCIKCKVLPLCMGGCQMKKKIKKEAWCNPEIKHQIDELVKLYYESLV